MEDMFKELECIEDILIEAVEMGGSDLHLVVGTMPRVRLHGKLMPLDYVTITERTLQGIVEKDMLDAYARTELVQQGQWDMSYTIVKGQETRTGKIVPNSARFRVNIFKQKGAYGIVFRVLSDKVKPFEQLNLPRSFLNLKRNRRGLVLVTGPTGSGKSTTLASIVDDMNKTQLKHIITLEQPIEYMHWHKKCIVNQREVGSDVASFKGGLRAALREDPDIILVGEMRDLETTKTAITAAETGHLVMSTLHTTGAVETINRIIDIYPESEHNQVRKLLSSILVGVISQQLLPRKDGKGYIVALEYVPITKEIKDMIYEDRIPDISKYLSSQEAKEEGMLEMDDYIYGLLEDDLITSETAVEYAVDMRTMQELV